MNRILTWNTALVSGKTASRFVHAERTKQMAGIFPAGDMGTFYEKQGVHIQ